MLHQLASLNALVALSLLLSSVANALPSSVTKRQLNDGSPQFVLAGDSSDVLASSAPLKNGREPDFVESMLIEAQRKGMDLSQWDVAEDQVLAIQKSLDVERESLREELEEVVDDALAWIQPAELIQHEEVHSSMQPGSGWVWNVCGTHQEAVVLKEINVKPDPPVPGQNLTVYAKGTVNAPLEDGAYADVVVKLGFIRLLSRRFDICELARENKADLQCPLQPGEYELTHTVELPREIPPARFNVHVSGKTQADVDLTCMDVSIDFSGR